MELTDAVWRDPGRAWSYRITATGGQELFRAALEPPGGAA